MLLFITWSGIWMQICGSHGGFHTHTQSPGISMLCSGAGGVLAFVFYLLLSLGSLSGSVLSHLQLVPGQCGSDGDGSALQVQLPAGTQHPPALHQQGDLSQLSLRPWGTPPLQS